MKTTRLIALGTMIGSCLIASAQGAPPPPDRPRQIPPEVLKKFDKDGDGKLNDEEREAAMAAGKAMREERRKEMLAKFDSDGDGELNDAESAAMREAMRAEMMKRYDTDGDGKLSDEERAKMPRFGRGPGGPDGKRRPGGQDRPQRPNVPAAPESQIGE